MVVLVDTNILIDYLLKRASFYADAQRVIAACSTDDIDGFVAFHSVSNIFYILRKSHTANDRLIMLQKICSVLTVTGESHDKIISALNSPELKDFEDCLQVKCAQEIFADYIVTRDVDDFSGSSIPAISPQKFLSII